MITKVSISLTPVTTTLTPEVTISVPGHSVTTLLQEPQEFEFEFDNSIGWIEVDFTNKPAFDPKLAVIVDKVEFFGISDPRFVWAGIYTPVYPEPWYSEQEVKPLAQLLRHNYMGWNGKWRLDFDVPVFTWMHRTLNLGWLYQ